MEPKLSRLHVPRAYDNFYTALSGIEENDAAYTFNLCWSAFNEIYSFIGQTESVLEKNKENKRLATTQRQSRNGKIILERALDHVQLNYVFGKFDDDFRHKLIIHESTSFFVNRVPMWEGQPIECDSNGVQLNGVLNVGLTINRDFPSWSPIDKQLYARYMYGEQSNEIRDELTWQIQEVLYTVRCNLLHGKKSVINQADMEVVKTALPLLICLVDYFLEEDK